MKKTFLLVAVALMVGTVAVNAQGGGGFQRRTVEERVQTIHQKMDSAFKLDKAKLTQVDSVFATFYRSTDKVREELMNSGGDRSTMREQMQEKTAPLVAARDKELQAVIGDDNFKVWKETIEPSMRRGGGGPPRQ